MGISLRSLSLRKKVTGEGGQAIIPGRGGDSQLETQIFIKKNPKIRTISYKRSHLSVNQSPRKVSKELQSAYGRKSTRQGGKNVTIRLPYSRMSPTPKKKGKF